MENHREYEVFLKKGKTMESQNRIKGTLLLLAGLFLLCYGLYLPFQPKTAVASENAAVIKEGIITTGEVTGIRKTMQKDPGKENNPEAQARLYEVASIKYAVDGKSYNATGLRPIQNPGWEKGDSVKVSYKIDDPKIHAVTEKGVEGVESHPYLPAILILIGILVSSTGIFFRLKRNQ